MLKMKHAEDFGLGFNCMCRLYMDDYDEELLIDMIKMCEEYLKWFSHRTIICSLRDLIKEYPYIWHQKRVPENQKERHETLIKVLIRQGIGIEKESAHFRNERECVLRLGDDIGVFDSLWGKEKGFDRDTFYQWILDNALNGTVVIKKERKDETLPLKKRLVPLFYKVCNYMIFYSYGRHTYMPSTCSQFVKDNIELMSDSAIGDIIEYLKTKNANIPVNESTYERIDSETWIYMQEDLEAELLTRKVFCAAQSKGADKIELMKLLDNIVDLDSLHTQKETLNMYHQIMGIERYLQTVADNDNMQRVLKHLEKEKQAIIKKRWEFWEKEEGHKYEKIGDGVYQRKRV